ncbi:glycine cleavage system protein [Scheffersomyces xylosifermentans]|uniref:glycine cleavage system protein n=1 Tax=Scheffersomyces xylosifermentans TaxID=1304137 RepID=UPI00315C6C89
MIHARALIRTARLPRVTAVSGARSAFLASRPVPALSTRFLATKADTSSKNYAKVFEPNARKVSLANLDTFARRHIGPTPKNVEKMLATLGYSDLDEFLSKAIPEHILFKRKLSIQPEQGFTESEMLTHLNEIANKNKIVKSFIGKGYAGTRLPPVIQRNLLESPEWYTSYTPYQPEISQGRLESLLNYQTVVTSLTGLPMANASLLDEGTAAGEAMSMSFHNSKNKKTAYVVDSNIHPQTLEVVKSRAENIGVTVVELPLSTDAGVQELEKIVSNVCGVLVQYPGTDGSLHNYTKIGEIVHANKGLFAMATDLLALTLIKPPSEFGADIALGTSQRFGVPFGYGGPHAAFFSTNMKYSRKIPGRIVGVSKDRLGNPALRLALQTREQHIKREKATSNICTAQALLANIAAMYAVYHGPEGLKNIAKRVYGYTTLLANEISTKHEIVNDKWFDTITVKLNGVTANEVLAKALNEHNINLFKVDESTVSITLDETVEAEDLVALGNVFTGNTINVASIEELPQLPQELLRTDKILPNAVFNTHHSETAMLRYLHLLQSKDLSLANSMIPLGSCTMKLNSTVEMQTLSMPGFSSIHPFAPLDQAQGYKQLVDEFEKDLNDITGFDATTSMPNSGAQGEYTGLSLIRQYHKSRGDYEKRNICLIPVSAHGTNPASAAMCGLKVVPVKCLANGSIDLQDLQEKAEKHAENLCSIMITYPSTYGLFEPGVKTAIDLVHKNGGLVYLDGANMNAQVGLTSPGDLGADVCHLNIHKTFALSHGGGGPGQAPVCVKEHLKPFLPSHHFLETPHSTAESIKSVNSAPYGSAAVIPVSYSYIKMLGANALPYVSTIAMLNANYMLARLREHYEILFVDSSADAGLRHCAHEFILDLREFKAVGIEAIDVAKRLQDYGFHAPTMSFPVAGTLMIEPTESENLEELDRFVDSLIAIRGEIDAYAKKEPLGLVLKNAPHPLQDIVATPQADWDARGYTREQAAYPLPFLKSSKCWPTVARLDDTYGDLNLNCTCPSVEEVVAAQDN